MAIKYGFFNSVNGDRVYNAEDVGRYLHGIITNGVYQDDTGKLQVLASSGMTVAVQTGRAMLSYHYMENDSAYSVTLDIGTTLPRIDLVVLRLDLTNRNITIAVKKGTPAASPSMPVLSRESTVYELALAAITVGANVSSITQANIQDLRPNSAYCGWVTGVVQQLDTSTLFSQWEAAYEAQYEQLGTEFQNWFDTLTEQLTVDTYIQEYKKRYTTAANDKNITIGIAAYDSGKDILFANINGVVFSETEDYTVEGTGATAVFKLKKPVSAGNTIEFRVLKSKIGSSTSGTT